MPDKKTAIITGAHQGIGAGLVEAFLKNGYNVVGTSLNVTDSLTASPSRVFVDGDISKPETAAKVVEAAMEHFGTVDVLVNNAGIFRTKPFTDFTTEDFNALFSINLLGFLYMTQLTVKQMLKVLIGIRSRRSRLQSGWPSSLVSPRSPALTRSESKCPTARS